MGRSRNRDEIIYFFRKLRKNSAMIIGGAVIFAGMVVYGLPAIVVALGFGATGIAAATTASWLMSLSGGATQAGSLVAICQSIGATGVVSSSTAIVGSLLGAIAGFCADEEEDQDQDEEQ